MTTRTNRRAKRLLEDAVPHVGRDVVVVAPGVNGNGYLGTSMPTRTAHELEDVATLLHESLKKVRRWQRARQREEQQLAESA